MAEAIILERRPSREAGHAGLSRRRVYIFPTRQGFLFAFLLIIMLLGAINYTNSMAYLLTFLLGSLFLVCMLHTYRNLRGLIVRSGDAESVFAGEAASFPLLFDNRGGDERVGLEARSAGRDAAPGSLLTADVAAGELLRSLVRAVPPDRGIFRLERLRLECRFPLGFFRAWAYLDSAPQCVVYPRPGGELPMPEAAETEFEQQTGRRPGTDDFAGFRAYRAGDSMRSIDWKALARERGLLAKRFTGAGSRRLRLSWDATPPAAGTEVRLSQLSRWVVDAERRGLEYALDLPGRFIDFGNGAPHRHDCLAALARHGL